MFGYVRPARDELKVREWDRYRAAYCGLCNTMGRRHGLVARMFLNYDFTFLAMLLSPERTELTQCRCPARLWCKKKACTKPTAQMDLVADESVILAYWKLQDAVWDSGFWKRQGVKVLALLLRPAYRRAARTRPEYARTVEECLVELRALEEENSPSLDRTADTFARILRASAPESGDSTRDRAMEQLLYHLGRWIYLVDAWDDLEEDRSNATYNPISARFPGAEEENRAYLRTTLCHSRNLASSACELLERGEWNGILENIIYLGLPTVEHMVFDGCWKRQKNRRMDS